jgi:Alginate export/Amino acid kinase family
MIEIPRELTAPRLNDQERTRAMKYGAFSEIELRPIKWLLERNTVVIAAGGGGIPTMYEPGKKRHLIGVEAVIDKDFASELLARELDADLFVMLTDADAVCLDWGKPSQRAIRRAPPAKMAEFPFPAGSMGPKVDAARTFAERTGKRAAIGALEDLPGIVAGEAGTTTRPRRRALSKPEGAKVAYPAIRQPARQLSQARPLRRQIVATLVMVAAASPAAAIELPAYSDDAGNQLVPSLSLEGAFFPQSQSWFGKSRDNLGSKSDYWFEEVAKLGLDGQVALSRFGNLYGRVSGFLAATQRTDAAGSNVPGDTTEDVSWEDAYVGWKSGTLFEDSLGTDALDLSYGRQRYQVGSGFLFWDAGSDGGQRAAYWIGPRKAFKQAAIAKFGTRGVEARGVFLEGNDNPHSNTQLYGADLQWSNEDLGSIGAGFYHIFNSDIDTRNGMDIYDVRADVTPLATSGVLPGLTLKGEYTFEDNGNIQEGHGYYGELGYDFGETLPWTPYLSYRYAHFSGNDPSSQNRSEDFDPLFYGFSDWGTWFQGEILGEYVLLNQNLNSSTLRLRLSPTEKLTLNLLYFHFSLDDAAGFGTSGSNFADEFDLVADYALNDNVSFSVVGAAADPHNGASNFTGGNNVWYYSMFYTNISF